MVNTGGPRVDAYDQEYADDTLPILGSYRGRRRSGWLRAGGDRTVGPTVFGIPGTPTTAGARIMTWAC